MYEIVTRHHRGQGQGERHRPARGAGPGLQGRLDVRPGPDGGQPRPVHPALLPPRVRGPHPRQALPGRRLQEPHPLRRPAREVHRLPGLQEGLPERLHPRARCKEVHLIDQAKCIKCGACYEACRFEAIEDRSATKPSIIWREHMITFRMNGLEVQAEEGSTILDTAKFYGLEIPTLCYKEGLTPLRRLPALRRRDRRGPEDQARLVLHLPGRGGPRRPDRHQAGHRRRGG